MKRYVLTLAIEVDRELTEADLAEGRRMFIGDNGEQPLGVGDATGRVVAFNIMPAPDDSSSLEKGIGGT